jgi:ATP-dependent exoDNAse (exonuclease V) beta subunit
MASPVAGFFLHKKPQHTNDKSYIGVTTWIRDLFDMSSRPISQYVARLGNVLHKDIEYYYKRKPVSNDTIEFQHFLQFVRDHPHLTPLESEKPVISENFKWRGIIDMVFCDDNEQYWIYDWKRSREITIDEVFPEELSKLEFSLYNSYVLQLNLYRIILEEEYDMNIQGMILVLFHPRNEMYQTIELPRLTKQIECDLLNLRLNQI